MVLRRPISIFFSFFLCRKEIMFYFCSVKTAAAVASLEIGLWCNGNTTDSGPVIPSSNLGSPTLKDRPNISDGLFFLLRTSVFGLVI